MDDPAAAAAVTAAPVSAGAMGGPAISRVSADDSTRVQQLTADARTPPARLTIVRQEGAIAIADD